MPHRPERVLDLFGEGRVPFGGFLIVGRHAAAALHLLWIAGATPVSNLSLSVDPSATVTPRRKTGRHFAVALRPRGGGAPSAASGSSAGVKQHRMRSRRQLDNRGQLPEEVDRIRDGVVDQGCEIL
jgi:hypothetical protein